MGWRGVCVQGQGSPPGLPEQGFIARGPSVELSLRAPNLRSAQGQGKLQTWHSPRRGSRGGRRQEGGGGEGTAGPGGGPERRERREDRAAMVKVGRDSGSWPPQLGH